MRAVPEARGKTGTTNNDVDAWFIGYVPKKIVAACWVGNDNNSPMSGAYGGTVCGPVWKEFMLKSIPIYDRIKAKAAPAEQDQSQKPAAGQPGQASATDTRRYSQAQDLQRER